MNEIKLFEQILAKVRDELDETKGLAEIHYNMRLKAEDEVIVLKTKLQSAETKIAELGNEKSWFVEKFPWLG